MKHFTLLLCIIFMLSLLGCGVTDTPSPAPTDDATVKAPTLETESEPSSEATEVSTVETLPPSASEKAEIPMSPVIETKYYTLTLPDEWSEICRYSVVDDITVTLREKSSYESFGGGKLCTLLTMSTDDDTYKDFPDYELLCALDTPDGSFYVIALFPTDVQFNEETMDIYNAMVEELMDVLWTIQPNNGIEMAMP